MATVTFDVPEGALSALRLSPTEFVKEMSVAAALLWYSQGEISQSKGRRDRRSQPGAAYRRTLASPDLRPGDAAELKEEIDRE
jgi:hypothetical protein